MGKDPSAAMRSPVSAGSRAVVRCAAQCLSGPARVFAALTSMLFLAAAALFCAGCSEGECARGERSATPVSAKSADELDRTAVIGAATFDGGERGATVVWGFWKDGVYIESTIPPRMSISAISASAPRIMVKLPAELFGLRVGDELVRRFDPPLSMHTDQPVTCSCQLREDCVAGVQFRCEIGGRLASSVAPDGAPASPEY